jgi:hypothetical protein
VTDLHSPLIFRRKDGTTKIKHLGYAEQSYQRSERTIRRWIEKGILPVIIVDEEEYYKPPSFAKLLCQACFVCGRGPAMGEIFCVPTQTVVYQTFQVVDYGRKETAPQRLQMSQLRPTCHSAS